MFEVGRSMAVDHAKSMWINLPAVVVVRLIGRAFILGKCGGINYPDEQMSIVTPDKSGVYLKPP